ncbi:MAG: type II secretion system protein GspM [Immundisolibacter sp.]|uniref:type II secretion system protein GspM n=1 Tax=Immundisolibacter sp. TaxID=1934948 RepID=UPI003D113C5E
MSAVDNLKAGWRQRSARERRLLLLAGGVLIALAGHALVWSPWQAARTRRAADNARLAADLAWLRGLAPQVDALRASQGSSAPQDGALPVRIDASLRAAGLGEHLQRLEPAADGSVRLWLDDAPFDALVGWLGALAQQGLEARTLGIGSGASAGRVDAQLLLAQ